MHTLIVHFYDPGAGRRNKNRGYYNDILEKEFWP